MIASGTTAAATTMNSRWRREVRLIGRSLYRFLQRALEALLVGERVAPAVAGRGQPLGRVGDAEIERVRGRELFPGERHRHRRSRLSARRVGDDERLAAHG